MDRKFIMDRIPAFASEDEKRAPHYKKLLRALALHGYYRRNKIGAAEEGLIFGIVAQTAVDISKAPYSIYTTDHLKINEDSENARIWVFEEKGGEHEFSFNWCCDAIDMCPIFLRKQFLIIVKETHKAHKAKILSKSVTVSTEINRQLLVTLWFLYKLNIRFPKNNFPKSVDFINRLRIMTIREGN